MELLAFIFRNFTAILTIFVASVGLLTFVDIMFVVPYIAEVEEQFYIN